MNKTFTLPELTEPNGIFTDGDWIESKDQDPNGGVRLIQLADIGDGEYLDKSSRYLTIQKAEELKCTFIQPGDILLARMPDPLGRACIFPGDKKPCIVAVDICIIRPNSRIVDRRWLLRKINSPEFRSRIYQYASGTTRARISRLNLSKIQFLIPPLPEQKRIAAILEKVGELRQKRRRSLALLDDLIQSVFLDMFGDPVTNPKGWRDVKLSEIAHIASGVTKGRKLPPSQTISVPYMRVANVQDGALMLDDVKEIEVLPEDIEKYRLEKGDILLTEGGDPDKLGRGAIWEGIISPCIHQNHIFRVRLETDEVIPEYLSALISSSRGKIYFLKAAKQTTGIASINKTQLSAFPVLIPPRLLQEEYCRWVKSVKKMKEKVQISALAFDTLFNSIQAKIFFIRLKR